MAVRAGREMSLAVVRRALELPANIADYLSVSINRWLRYGIDGFDISIAANGNGQTSSESSIFQRRTRGRPPCCECTED